MLLMIVADYATFAQYSDVEIKKNHWLHCIDSLLEKAKYYSNSGDYELSTKYYEQTILYFDSMGNYSLIPQINNLIAENDIGQGIAFLKKKQYNTARFFCMRASRRAEPESKIYKTAHRWIGDICDVEATEIRSGTTNLERAVALCEEGEQHFDTAGDEYKKLKIRLLRATKLVTLNRKDEAKDIYTKIITLKISSDSIQTVLGEANYHLGELETEEGKYDLAIKHLETGYELYDKVGNAAMASVVAKKLSSLFNYQIGDRVKAEVWKQRASKYDTNNKENRVGSTLFDKTKQETNVRKAITAFNKKIKEGKIEEGLKEGRLLAAQLDNDTNISLIIKADCYSFISTGEAKKGDFKAAVVDIRHCIRLLNAAGVEGEKQLKSEWYALAVYLWRSEDYDGALSAADTCVAVANDYYGPLHEETMDAYLLRGDMNANRGNKEQALNDMSHYFNIAQVKIQQNFVYLTKTERNGYWKRYEGTMRRMPFFAYELKDFESEYTDVLFNEQLLAKGLLITTESLLQKAINEDSNLQEYYNKIRLLRKKADAPQTSKSEAEHALIESGKLERELGNKANSIYQFTNFLKIEKKDVQKHLSPDAVAVEFVDFKDKDGKLMLGALVLSHKRTHARLIPLVTENELRKRQSEIGELIWQPILNAIGEGVRDIYFAPTGILHLLPLESAVLKNGIAVENAKCKLHRVSSTRWIVPQQNLTRGNGSVVYGGLRYDLTVEELLAVLNVSLKESEKSMMLGKDDSKKGAKRGVSGLDYLKGSKMEAMGIAQTLKLLTQDTLNVELKIGAKGTEESFKALNGKHKHLIHIATHGIFDTNANDANMDAVLNRCGLYFAGADNKRLGESLPKGIEDGFLSATEISEMDLQGLQLVTLSACETGKGSVNGDGVFGLQRGFKKAGARSLLMSLWKVDDRATSVLMTEFYRLWLGGMSMHDALESAKKKVRSTKGWESPEFWAAFILLDGD